MLKYFDDILGKDLSFWVLIEFLFYFSVRITPDALPLAVLLSSIMTYGEFAENYDLTPNTIKNKLYREENPNTYLASFARFLIENKSNEYFKEIIFKGLERFIEYQILQYDDFSKVDIHYVGSIAFYLQDEIKRIGKKYNLNTGNFIKSPIEGLVDYHKRNIIK